MKKSIWSFITYLTSYLTVSPVNQDDSQRPMLGPHGRPVVSVHNEVNVVNVAAPTESIAIADPVAPAMSTSINTPSAGLAKDDRPPTPRQLPGSNFLCEYPTMKGWEFCTEEQSHWCWLRRRGNSNPIEPNDKGSPDKTGFYSIFTDYEKYAPKGIQRNYTLVIEDGRWNADGLWANDAKLINGTYPGPLIEACWGDTISIKVINKLKHNGTAIHWHGIRQHESMPMDGVPGITQCPIAPNDYFTYKFNTTQYGDSWYHSHYSVQYADGMLGPLVIHGPSSSSWDYHEAPLLISDWFHNSAFQVIHKQVPGYPTILLNGVGDISKHHFVSKDRDGKEVKDPNGDTVYHRVTPNAPVPPKYQVVVKQGKKHILRIINTSFATTFDFSIDGHQLVIVGADLVPLWPTRKVTHITVGIGQRYSVVVEADAPDPPEDNPAHPEDDLKDCLDECLKSPTKGRLEFCTSKCLEKHREKPKEPEHPEEGLEKCLDTCLKSPIKGRLELCTSKCLEEHRERRNKKRPANAPHKNFWIRTSIVPCFGKVAIGIDDYDQVGILRYDPDDIQTPTSKPWPDLNTKCRDETELRPMLRWDLTKGRIAQPREADASNPRHTITEGKDFSAEFEPDDEEEDVTAARQKAYPLAQWAFDQVDLEGNPTKEDWVPLQIDYHDPFLFHLSEINRTDWDPRWVIIDAPYKDDEWVFMLITGIRTRQETFKAAHPMHLHGHDFALLQMEEKMPPRGEKFKFKFNLNNPVRRDSVLLPAEGWVVIAFKADNPGSWILHCHIAFHASEGLALQINERQEAANKQWPYEFGNISPELLEAHRVCTRWRHFETDCTQHWPGYDEKRRCWPACDTGKFRDAHFACNKKGTHVFQDDSGV